MVNIKNICDMKQYIDKDAVVAEIARRIKYDEMVMDHNTQITELLSRELNTLYELSSFIKSLEVKEVDIEKEVMNWWNDHYSRKDYTFEKYNGHYLENSIVIDLAKHFFELGLKAQKGE